MKMLTFKGRMAAAVACLGMAAVAVLGSTPVNAAEASSGDGQALAMEVFEKLEASADAEALFGQLTPEEQDAFNDHFLAAGSTTTVTVQPDDAIARMSSAKMEAQYSSVEAAGAAVARATGCWQVVKKFTQVNAIRVGLFDVYTEGRWCSNGNSSTSPQFKGSWSTVGSVGWRDTGSGPRNGITTIQSNRALIIGQRVMKLGIGGWDPQTQDPCLRISGFRDGVSTATINCATS